MNYLDIVLCIPLIWGAWRGLIKGFIIEVSTLIALGLGIYGGIHFSDLVASGLSTFIDVQGNILHLISFALTFIGIVILVHILARLLEKVVNLVAMKFLNKLAGCIFGLAKMALILSVLLFILDRTDKYFSIFPENLREESLLYKPLGDLAPNIIPAIKNSGLMSNIKERLEEDDVSD